MTTPSTTQTLDFSNNPQDLVDANATLIGNIVSQAVVTPVGQSQTPGISGFLFDVTSDEEIENDAIITDHYTEDNSSIQDHIAHKPIQFTVKGYVAELVNNIPQQALTLLAQLQGLPLVADYLPTFTTQATALYTNIANTAAQVGNVINQLTSFYQLFQNMNTSPTKQQGAYNYFSAMKAADQLFTVETPFGILNNMAIETMRALQKEESNIVSDFIIRFKQIRTVSTTVVTPTPATNNPAGSGAVSSSTNALANTAGISSPTQPAQNSSLNVLSTNAGGREAQYLQMGNPVAQGTTSGTPTNSSGQAYTATGWFSGTN